MALHSDTGCQWQFHLLPHSARKERGAVCFVAGVCCVVQKSPASELHSVAQGAGGRRALLAWQPREPGWHCVLGQGGPSPSPARRLPVPSGALGTGEWTFQKLADQWPQLGWGTPQGRGWLPPGPSTSPCGTGSGRGEPRASSGGGGGGMGVAAVQGGRTAVMASACSSRALGGGPLCSRARSLREAPHHHPDPTRPRPSLGPGRFSESWSRDGQHWGSCRCGWAGPWGRTSPRGRLCCETSPAVPALRMWASAVCSKVRGWGVTSIWAFRGLKTCVPQEFD